MSNQEGFPEVEQPNDCRIQMPPDSIEGGSYEENRWRLYQLYRGLYHELDELDRIGGCTDMIFIGIVAIILGVIGGYVVIGIMKAMIQYLQ